MRIAEALRQRTLAARDRVKGLDERIADAEAERDAAEERVVRASTEITQHRAREAECKRAFNESAQKVAEAQGILDDLEQKRQEALDVLIQCRDDEDEVSTSLRAAQEANKAALAEFRKEQKTRQDAEAEIARVRDKRQAAKVGLHRAMMESLSSHLEQQAALLQAAFATQEQRSKATRDLEAFKRARHTDAEVGRLCDERDEVQKLFDNTMVPGVKAMLQSSLKGIEETLAERFPGVLQMLDQSPEDKDNQIEELLFYCDGEGKAVCLLPVAVAEWSTEASPTERTSKAMCLVWNMIRGLSLRTMDGEFTVVNGRSAFASQLDVESVESKAFSVKCEGIEVIRYVCTLVPPELQEAIAHEDQDG